MTLALAQEKDETEEGEETPPSIEEEVEDWTYYEGLFDLYLDPESGDLSMVIEAEDLGKEYIHFIQTKDGVLEAGHFVVVIAVKWSFRIEKSYDKIEFIQENTSFYFDPRVPSHEQRMPTSAPLYWLLSISM